MCLRKDRMVLAEEGEENCEIAVRMAVRGHRKDDILRALNVDESQITPYAHRVMASIPARGFIPVESLTTEMVGDADPEMACINKGL